MSDRKSWEGYLPVTAAMFGDFRFEAGPSSITGKLNGSRKMSSLLAYLMLHPNTNVPVSELLEILWPDNERDDPANALKTLVYRVRSMLKEDGFPYYRECFIVKNGTYRWNPEITCVIDAVEFEQLCKAAFPKDNADSEKELLLKKAVGLYKGEFLPKCASEEWVIPLSAYYQSLYLRSVLALCEILKERKRYGEVSDYCRKALILEPLEEELNYNLILSLWNNSQGKAALEHYAYVKELFFTKLGVNLSEKLRTLAEKIEESEQHTTTDLSDIRSDLKEPAGSEGAFFCEYSSFKQIYRLQERMAARSDKRVYVVLLTMTDLSSRSLPQEKQADAMNRLLTILLDTLRKSDVVSRYSTSQYVMLLSAQNAASAQIAVERVVSNFCRKHSAVPALIHYTIQSMDAESKNLSLERRVPSTVRAQHS